AGFASTAFAFDAIQARSDSTSIMSLHNGPRWLAKNACAVRNDSPVTYSLGQDSPQPLTSVSRMTSAQRVEVSDRSADACRKATAKGIRSGVSSTLRRRWCGMSLRSDVVVKRELQVLAILQHNRLELAFALTGADARHLVCFGYAGSH